MCRPTSYHAKSAEGPLFGSPVKMKSSLDFFYAHQAALGNEKGGREASYHQMLPPGKKNRASPESDSNDNSVGGGAQGEDAKPAPVNSSSRSCGSSFMTEMTPDPYDYGDGGYDVLSPPPCFPYAGDGITYKDAPSYVPKNILLPLL